MHIKVLLLFELYTLNSITYIGVNSLKAMHMQIILHEGIIHVYAPGDCHCGHII